MMVVTSADWPPYTRDRICTKPSGDIPAPKDRETVIAPNTSAYLQITMMKMLSCLYGLQVIL